MESSWEISEIDSFGAWPDTIPRGWPLYTPTDISSCFSADPKSYLFRCYLVGQHSYWKFKILQRDVHHQWFHYLPSVGFAL